MKVYDALAEGDVEEGQIRRIHDCGRDTKPLSREGIIRAAVETVAENTSDGVIAPLLYMALGGPVFGFLYKGINTMDSMVGYHNERYEYFGRAAARLDDAANFLRSRNLCSPDAGGGLSLRDGREKWLENLSQGQKKITKAPTPPRRRQPAQAFSMCSWRGMPGISAGW